jgi:cobalt-zinc-cadmium resistance protein CzcA
VYARQKDLLQEEWKSSLLNVSVKQAQLRKQVAHVFYSILYIKQKKQLLQYADSLYTIFYKKAELRLSKGEANVLEKASAETQLGQIQTQLQQLREDSVVLQLQFQLLLNTAATLVPEGKNYKMLPDLVQDSTALREHPLMKVFEQQKQIAENIIEVEKSRLLPDLTIGYNNTSMQGIGADDKFYNSSARFGAVQVGVGIPIFFGTQKARINSAKFNKQIVESNYTSGLQNLQTEYESALRQYNKYLQSVSYYENTALKNAELISATANKQLSAGSINYLEWVQLINQALTVKNDYAEAVKNLNEVVIQLNYLNNK